MRPNTVFRQGFGLMILRNIKHKVIGDKNLEHLVVLSSEMLNAELVFLFGVGQRVPEN